MQNDKTMAARKSGPAHHVYTNLVDETLTPPWRVAGKVLLLFLLAFPPLANAAGKADTCMAGICLNTPTVTQKMLVARYGPGKKRSDPGAEEDMLSRCYYDKNQDLYVEFTFDKHAGMFTESDLVTIMVSPVPMCPQRYTPKRPFPKLVAGSGLTVGSTVAEVEAALDKPLRIVDVAERERTQYATDPRDYVLHEYISSAYGSTKLVYVPDPENDLLYNEFYISDGKVKSILLSVSE